MSNICKNCGKEVRKEDAHRFVDSIVKNIESRFKQVMKDVDRNADKFAGKLDKGSFIDFRNSLGGVTGEMQQLISILQKSVTRYWTTREFEK